MENSLKSFVVKFGIVIGTLVVLGGLWVGTRSYSDYLKEQNHLQAQATIRAMVAFCDFTKMSEDEQRAVEQCGDDVEAARFKLRAIIEDRIVFWRSRMADVMERVNKVEAIKRSANYWDYSNEQTYRRVMGSLADEGKVAVGQHEAWMKRKKDLADWKPTMSKDTKTLVDPKPSGKGPNGSV